MNPSNERHVERLVRKVEKDRDALAPLRAGRNERLEQIATDSFNRSEVRKRAPVPLLALAMAITTRQLIGRNPRVRTTTRVRDLRPEAAAYQEDVNHTICEMELAKILRRIVGQAWCGPAFAKMGLDGDDKFFVEDVDFDDWVHDVHAKAPGKWQYCGNAYRVPLEWAKENKRFKKSVRDRLSADEPPVKDEKGRRRANNIMTGTTSDLDDDLDPHVTLHDFWIPGDQVMVTIPWSEQNRRTMALSVEEWDGPERGPYLECGLGLMVPGSSVPISPAVPLAVLDRVINRIWRDIIDGALSHKELYAVGLGAEEDAEAIEAAATRTLVKVNRPGEIQRLEFGIPNQALLALATMLQQLFSWLAGNLDVMGGLAPGSGTVGQDRLMNANASKVIEDYQSEMVDFVVAICRQIGWYRWHSDAERLHTLKVPGVSLEFTTPFGPNREGSYPDYQIEVEPFSLQYRSPNEQLATLGAVMQQHVYPNMQYLQSRGTVWLPEKLLKTVGDLANLPELDEMFIQTEPREMGESGEPTQNARYSQREYTRRSVPSGTEATRQQGMVQAMLKAGQAEN